MEFAGKVVLITGASSGIGAACALKFAEASASLSLVGRNGQKLTETSNKCQEISGRKPLSIIADISVEKDVERIVKETINEFGRIDILVNNAGFSQLAGIRDGIEPFDRIFATNVRGTYLLTSLAVPHLIETKGNIVNISSVLSTQASPIMAPYCMSKATVDMLTKCVALEVADQGVRVNAVNPGPVYTEFFKRSGLDAEQNEKVFKGFEERTPIKRFGRPEDIAELVLFLASDKARCITGSTYLSDSGLKLGDISSALVF